VNYEPVASIMVCTGPQAINYRFERGLQTRDIEPRIKESGYKRDLVSGFGDSVHTSLGIVSGVGGVALTADIVIGTAIGLK
jgi:hypothetical protein